MDGGMLPLRPFSQKWQLCRHEMHRKGDAGRHLALWVCPSAVDPGPRLSCTHCSLILFPISSPKMSRKMPYWSLLHPSGNGQG